MGRIVVKCEKCGEIGLTSNTINPIDKINNCGGRMTQVNLTEEEFDLLCNISSENSFLDAMIELKKNDIIEYNLKMSQFKSQAAQEQTAKIQSDTRPRCPHCKSLNISKIGAGERITSVAMLGVFSKKINKSFKCKKCGYTW